VLPHIGTLVHIRVVTRDRPVFGTRRIVFHYDRILCSSDAG